MPQTAETAAGAVLENCMPENKKGDPKSYTFKRPVDTDGKPIPGSKYRVHDRISGELLEGFEENEFGTPLEGGRFMAAILYAAEQSGIEAAKLKIIPAKDTVADPIDGSVKELRHTESTIPVIGEISQIEVIGGCEYFEMRVHEQDGDSKRKDILVTDGVSRDFLVQFDKNVILPKGAYNVFSESVYDAQVCVYDSKEGKAWMDVRPVPRFSIQIIRKVPQAEAEAWLKEQSKRYIKI